MRKAFSLVELSIVIIIIALLIAGVSSGSKLIEDAARKRLIKEFDTDKAQLTTFISVYDAYPGDMKNASSFWSTTTNGLGDGIITAGVDEIRYWEHMELAGLHPDDSLEIVSACCTTVLTNSMGGKGLRKRAYNSATYANLFTSHTHMYHYGAGGLADDKFFIPNEAYLIDLKIDDGLPKEGDMSFKPAGSTTDALCTGSTTSYLLSAVAKGCNIVIYNGL